MNDEFWGSMKAPQPQTKEEFAAEYERRWAAQDPCAICESPSYFHFDRDGEEYNCPELDCPKRPGK